MKNRMHYNGKTIEFNGKVIDCEDTDQLVALKDLALVYGADFNTRQGLNIKLSNEAPPLADHEQTIDVDQLLSDAVKNKDISSDTAKNLKEQYQNMPQKLPALLQSLKEQRIKYLMSLDWDALDKKDLLTELKQKFYNGFKEKYHIKFGKFPKDDATANNDSLIAKENEKLLKFAIANKDVTPEEAAVLKNNFKDNPQKLKEILNERKHSRIETLMNMSWSDLDKKGLLEELKQKYLQGFKTKHKIKFGTDWKGDSK
jgi:hypothetical protein